MYCSGRRFFLLRCHHRLGAAAAHHSLPPLFLPSEPHSSHPPFPLQLRSRRSRLALCVPFCCRRQVRRLSLFIASGCLSGCESTHAHTHAYMANASRKRPSPTLSRLCPKTISFPHELRPKKTRNSESSEGDGRKSWARPHPHVAMHTSAQHGPDVASCATEHTAHTRARLRRLNLSDAWLCCRASQIRKALALPLADDLFGVRVGRN
jgi:hypothetical protein